MESDELYRARFQSLLSVDDMVEVSDLSLLPLLCLLCCPLLTVIRFVGRGGGGGGVARLRQEYLLHFHFRPRVHRDPFRCCEFRKYSLLLIQK